MLWLWSDPIVQLAAVLALAAVFLAAAGAKFAALSEFSGVVANYRLLPEPLVLPVAYLLPILELLGGVAILIPGTRTVAAWGLLVLLILFTSAITVNLLRGRTHIDCGCFNLAARQAISWWLVVRNSGIAALLVLALLPTTPRTSTALDLVSAIGAAAVLAVIYAATPMLDSARLTRTLNLDGPVEEGK